jgi:hypothetical protein
MCQLEHPETLSPSLSLSLSLSLSHSSVILDGETNEAASILDEEKIAALRYTSDTHDEVETRAVQSRHRSMLA